MAETTQEDELKEAMRRLRILIYKALGPYAVHEHRLEDVTVRETWGEVIFEWLDAKGVTRTKFRQVGSLRIDLNSFGYEGVAAQYAADLAESKGYA